MSKLSRVLGLWLLVVGLLTPAGFPQSRGADLWPQWRGPNRDAHITPTPWPVDLTDHLTLSWKIPQGPGYSGPIVSEERVFVTETIDEEYECVRALDRFSGKQLWERQWKGAIRVPFFAASNGSWIRSTPVFDGQRLYVAGIRDRLVCLDAASGEIVWQVDFAEATGSEVPSFGCVSSPLILREHLYVQAAGGLVKLNKSTGEILWRTFVDGGGMTGGAFSSPTVATLAGLEQLVIQTRTHLAGVNLADGSELWSYEIPSFRGMNILTPTVIGDRIFTSSYGGRSWMFVVSHDESHWKVAEVWNHKSQGYMSSPVVIGEHIYLHLKNQRLTCLHAPSGEERWTTTPFGKYWSMIANGNRLLALDQQGELLLIEASPTEFRLLDRYTVGDDAWAHLAIAGNQVFVRNLDGLRVYDWK